MKRVSMLGVVLLASLTAYAIGTFAIGNIVAAICVALGLNVHGVVKAVLIAWLIFRLGLLFVAGFVTGSRVVSNGALWAGAAGVLVTMGLTLLDTLVAGVPPAGKHVSGGTTGNALLYFTVSALQIALAVIGGYIASRRVSHES